MSNDFYSATGAPSTRSQLNSQVIRTEFGLIEDGLDKFPAMSGNASKVWAFNSSATAVEALNITGTGSVVLEESPTLSGTIGGSFACSGNLTFNGTVTLNGILSGLLGGQAARFQGATIPAGGSGVGAEVGVSGSSAFLQGWNSTSSALAGLALYGSSLEVTLNSANVASLDDTTIRLRKATRAIATLSAGSDFAASVGLIEASANTGTDAVGMTSSTGIASIGGMRAATATLNLLAGNATIASLASGGLTMASGKSILADSTIAAGLFKALTPASTIVPNSGEGFFHTTATQGAVLYGSGSSTDVSILNGSLQEVMVVPNGTTQANFQGNVVIVGNFQLQQSLATISDTPVIGYVNFKTQDGVTRRLAVV